jgi:chain length determinant protein EpsF
MPNKYVATTTVLLDVKSPDPLISTSLAGMTMPSYMATQIDIITSQRVAQSVVKMLKLDVNPQVRNQWLEATKGKGQMIVWLGKVFSNKLEAKPSRESNVISISYASEDPLFAATVANAYAQAYINTNLELKVEPARQNAEWFQERVAGLRQELEKAQGKLAEYQKQTGMVSTGSKTQNLENTNLFALSNQLVLNESQFADTQSKNKHIGSGDTLADVMQNPVVVSLKGQINTLEAKLQEASRNLGKNHPEYQAMESEIASLKQKLDAETKQIINSINTANTVNKQKGSELKATIESHKKEALQESAQRDQIAVLENDVESAQKAYDLVVQRYTESNLQSQSNQTNISILNPASEPSDPSSPKVVMYVIISVFVGMLLGVGAALIAELLDQRVRNVESLIAVTGVPLLMQFTQNIETISIKQKLLNFVRSIGMKFKFRKTVTVLQ